MVKLMAQKLNDKISHQAAAWLWSAGQLSQFSAHLLAQILQGCILCAPFVRGGSGVWRLNYWWPNWRPVNIWSVLWDQYRAGGERRGGSKETVLPSNCLTDIMSWCPVCITWGTDWLRCWCRTVSHRYRHHWMCRMPARLCRGSTPDETREAAVADNYHLGGPSLCAPVSQWEAADVVWRPMRLRGQAVLHPSLLSLLWAPVQLVMLPTAHWWLAHHCQLSSQSIADQSVSPGQQRTETRSCVGPSGLHWIAGARTSTEMLNGLLMNYFSKKLRSFQRGSYWMEAGPWSFYRSSF